jgi:hypothetical protein
MSPRSTYLRDQAEKCRWHADRLADVETKERLQTLAAEYLMRAAAIESEELSHGAYK